MHDLSNKKSYSSLQRWLAQLRLAQSREDGISKALPWLRSGSPASPLDKQRAASRASLDAVGDYDPEASAGSRYHHESYLLSYSTTATPTADTPPQPQPQRPQRPHARAAHAKTILFAQLKLAPLLSFVPWQASARHGGWHKARRGGHRSTAAVSASRRPRVRVRVRQHARSQHGAQRRPARARHGPFLPRYD